METGTRYKESKISASPLISATNSFEMETIGLTEIQSESESVERLLSFFFCPILTLIHPPELMQRRTLTLMLGEEVRASAGRRRSGGSSSRFVRKGKAEQLPVGADMQRSPFVGVSVPSHPTYFL